MNEDEGLECEIHLEHVLQFKYLGFVLDKSVTNGAVCSRKVMSVRMERNRIANRVYVGECAGNHSVGRPQKRWIDTMKKCLRKRGLDVRQARRRVQDRSGFLRVDCIYRIFKKITLNTHSLSYNADPVITLTFLFRVPL